MAKRAFAPAQTRNLSVIGHGSSGKTSLAENVLATAGVTRSIGRVDDGTSLLDHTHDEHRRRASLDAGFAWFEWGDTLIHLVDVPGTAELTHAAELAIQGSDAVVAVISAPDGVEQGTSRMLRAAAARELPVLVVVNKMDRCLDPGPDLDQLAAAIGMRPLPLQLPHYDDDGVFDGVVDVQARRLLRYDLDGTGAFSPEPLDADWSARADQAWEGIVEAVALTDDALLEEYLEFLELPDTTVLASLFVAVRDRRIVPVVYASAERGMGAVPLLDAIVAWLPSPGEAPRPRLVDGTRLELDDQRFVAQVVATSLDAEGELCTVVRVWSGEPPADGLWRDAATGATSRVRKLWQVRGPRRTRAVSRGPGSFLATWDRVEALAGATVVSGRDQAMRPLLAPAPLPPMAWIAVSPTDGPRRSGSDAESRRRLDEALRLVPFLDRGIEISRCPLTGSPILGAASRLQLDRLMTRLAALGLPLRAARPLVPYRETPRRRVAGVEGTHRKAIDGLVSELAECRIDLGPGSVEDELAFAAPVDPDAVPVKFHGAIGQGVREGLAHGPRAGYPVTGAVVQCVGGNYDILESTEEHFRVAGEQAARTALFHAGSDVLEPWQDLVVHVPADHVGAVTTDLSARRCRITALEVDGDTAVVGVLCPVAVVHDLAAPLRSLSGGLGWFRAGALRWDRMPEGLVATAVQASPFLGLAARPDSSTPGRAPQRQNGAPRESLVTSGRGTT